MRDGLSLFSNSITSINLLLWSLRARPAKTDPSWMRKRLRRTGARGFEVRVTAPIQGHRGVLDFQAGAEGRPPIAPIIHHQSLPMPPAVKVEEALALPDIDDLGFQQAKRRQAPLCATPAAI